MSRRRLMGVSLATASAILLSACQAPDPDAPAASAPPPAHGSSLEAPHTLASTGGALEVTLTVTEQEVQIDGQTVRARVYNGSFVAPTLEVSPGDTLVVHLKNQLPEPTNIHFHGMHVSPKGASDNIFVESGTGQDITYTLKIPDDHEPGLYWYHSHLHGISEGQVFGGLSGLLVVRGLTELLPKNLHGVTQHNLALRDYQVKDGAIPADDIDSGAPTTRVINGQVNPTIDIAPGETQVWHVANIGADIWYNIAISGVTMNVIAEDGSPVWKVWEADDLVLPPGKRFSVIVRGPAAGSLALETLAYDQGKTGDQYPKVTLATVRSTGTPVEPTPLPSSLIPEENLEDGPFAETRTFDFSEDNSTNEFFINGKMFDPARVDASPMVGTVEKWILTNTTEEEHPFHIHVNDFQVLSVNGKPYDAHSRQDTVVLPVGGKVVIANPFDDYTGKFVFHCHILAHEDLGMMAVVDVVNKKGQSTSHGQVLDHDMPAE